MKRCFAILVVLSMILINACRSKPPEVPVEPTPKYQENFMKIHIKADPRLNLYDGTSHALHLCVYQLSDPNAFVQSSENPADIAKLMSCDRSGPGVALSKRFVFQPGQESTIELDRAEGAKYIGVVAGYYSLKKEHAIRLYTIPVVEEKKGGLIITKQVPLNIELYLGPYGLQDLQNPGVKP